MSTLDKPDPVRLEIFQNLYQFIAEQMGIVLQNTAASVNIKERLDFSCAIFDSDGLLVANAPHIPVHLGSMSASVISLIKEIGANKIEPGDVYLSNNPYKGGTHLPDVTAIAPVFISNESQPIFYVASRGHQADIGGITPGSMPPTSRHIEEEGILLDNFLLMERKNFREAAIRKKLADSIYPARNPEQNIADFQAQIAANNRGLQELKKMVEYYGLATVRQYMKFVQDAAEVAVKGAIALLPEGEFTCELDNQARIRVKVTINRSDLTATIDFTGTSRQLENNFNAPAAVCQAAILYVFRTLVKDNIPLNAGCLKPLTIIIPPGSMLNPQYPAAVVAGNVETSQNITDCLYGALGVMAASGGTMNNLTFGNAQYQYYETICSGSGAGKNFSGANGVQTHMTNSLLTDPEILELRYPVQIEEFSIRDRSGGVGIHSGGDGVVRKIRFLESMTVGILSNRRRIAPFGLAGGSTGKTGGNYLRKPGQQASVLGSQATFEVQPGEVLIVKTPGGGGYGKL